MKEMDGSARPSQDPSSPPVNGGGAASLDRSLARGVAWMGSVKWLTQLFTWASTIIVARLLSPADYGLVGLASLYLGIVTLLSEFGIGTTVVTMRDLSHAELAQINTLAMMFGALSFAVSCLAAPFLSSYFDAPQLTTVVIAMATIFLITGARVVPRAMLQRDMRFRDLAINDGIQAFLLAAGSVILAALGFRYWTLVLSAIIGAAYSTVGVLRLVRVPYRWPKWNALSPALRFSRRTIVGRLAWYTYSNADFFVAGKLLGKESLGAYRFGWDLANTPGEKLTSLVGGVTPSILSAAQNDPPALRRLTLRVTEALALVTLPTTIGLALVAGNLVPLALGEKWVEMIAPLQILGIGAAIRSVTPILPQILVVTGKNRGMMLVNVAGAVVMPIAFLIGSRWGTSGIALGWLIVYPLAIVLPMATLAFRGIGLSAGEYFRALRAPLTGIGAMCGAVWTIRLLYPSDTARATSLALDVLVGAAAYLGAAFAFHRDRIRSYITRIRAALA